MSLEEYEALMAEKKKALNKSAEAKNVDPNAELKGLKVFTKQSTEEQVRGALGENTVAGMAGLRTRGQ